MTLIIAATAPWGIHVGSEYRLSLADKSVDEEKAGVKQIDNFGLDHHSHITFTGAARGPGYNTREWITKTIVRRGPSSLPQDWIESLLASSVSFLTRVPAQERLLSILVLTGERKTLRVSLLSNFEHLNGIRLSQPSPQLELEEFRPSRPRLIILGQRHAISRNDRRTMLAALRSQRAPDQLRQLLADSIARAAHAHSPSTVGSGCMTQSLMPEGGDTSKNFGQTAGVPDAIICGINVGKWLRNNLQSDDGSSNLFKHEIPDPTSFGGASSAH